MNHGGIVAALALSSLALAGCARAPAEGGPNVALPVKVSQLVERSVTDYADFTGRTMAVEAVRLRARVWGHLEKINFVEGADVKKGDLLFVIDQRAYKVALARTEAELAQSEARCARLSKDYKRAIAMSSTKSISQEELDKTAGDLSEAGSAVKSAAAARDTAKLNLEFTEIRSPIDGQISRALVTTGNMVESGETGGTVLTTIMSTDTMYVYFDVDDQTFLRIRKLIRGSTSETPMVHIALSNERGFPHVGKLDFVDNQVEAGTGTLRMRGLFPNLERALTPGLFVRVRVPLGVSHPALLINDRAIDTDQGQKVIYVVNAGNIVEKRSVKLGGLHDGLREVQGDLQPRERVVVEGIQRVRAGASVAPEVIDMPVSM
jgi:RND family efflux transporter MFP subunit